MDILDIRRLAAIDMYGLEGTKRRRNLITAEYVFGVIAGFTFGIFILAASEGTGWMIFGIALLGVGFNYIGLTAHAFSLFDQDRLREELAGLDIRAELRKYTAKQIWLLIPYFGALLALIQLPAAFRSTPSLRGR